MRYYTVVSYVQILAQMLMIGYVLYCFAKPFMKNRKAATCAGISYFLAMLLLYLIPLSIDAFMAYGIGCLAAFLVMYGTDRRNRGQKLFITVTFYSLQWFSSAMAEILYDNLYAFAEKTDFMVKRPHMYLPLYIGVCMFYLVAEFIFMRISIWCISKAYVYKYTDMTKGELLMLTLPSFTGVMGYGIMWYYRMFYITEIGKNSAVYDILTFLYYGVSVITIVVVIVLYQRIKARQEEKIQNELLEAQIGSTEKHIKQVESLYRDIRSIKHDMTNHILTLEGLYAGNKTEDAKAYSTDLKAALSQMTGEIKSGNPITDVILQELKNEAEKKKLHFQSDFYYPTDSNVNAFDVSVILNNALQNAMENAGKCEIPYISIRSYHRNNAYMIEIRNSFTGSLQWDAESGLPVTSKRKTDEHGYGLANIRRVARKYSGDIAIDLKDGEFCLSIMLMME